MTGIRQSMVWALEDSFGGGVPSGAAWRAPPPGTWFSSSHQRGASKITEEGNKFFATYAFGTLQGSFDWSFTLDYDYLDPLLLVFEDYSCEKTDSGYVHTFSKSNSGRVPSFTVRRKVLNAIAGGPSGSDETVELRGCVAKSLTISNSAGSSRVGVSITGMYRDEVMTKGALGETDYTPYDGDLVEFACLFEGDPSCDSYFRNIDSLQVSVDNSVSAVYSTCTPFASQYCEGATSVALSATGYSNDPARFKQRVYSGGCDPAALFPRSKNLAPVDELTVAAYSLAMRDDGQDTVGECIDASPKTFIVTLGDVVLRALTWQKGDGSRLQDQINGTDARSVAVRAKHPTMGDLRTDFHPAGAAR